jgi:uncharacterized radical SAM superfamily Fe-S cluster-containing enzyme
MLAKPNVTLGWQKGRSTTILPPYEVSHNVDLYPREIQQYIDELLGKRGTVIRVTKSLCPDCVHDEKFGTMVINAIIFAEEGEVKLIKRCDIHGIVEDKYWEDYDMFRSSRVAADFTNHLDSAHVYDKIDEIDIDCPKMCGLCSKHKSHTGLGNIVITNRCDLSCWYCFFYAKEGESIYEPSLDQVRMMLRAMKDEKPVGANAVQITGGEPTVRKDFIDILSMAWEEGYDHVQLNCHGRTFAANPDLAVKSHDVGCSTLYMSFDGMDPAKNNKNFWEAPRTLDSLRLADLGVVLVPTVIGGVNDQQLGDILRFAATNVDIVRGVSYQPVSLVGRMPTKKRQEQRITIPKACKLIEEQTQGQVRKEDFFTVPVTTRISNFVEAMQGGSTYNLSIHFSCGVGTYVFVDSAHDRLIPITRFVDADGLTQYLDYLGTQIKESKHKSLSKVVAAGKLLWKLRSFVKEDQQPEGLYIAKLMYDAFMHADYRGLWEFHEHSLFIGMMHFMDPYNYDIDRVERCDIHYAMPDGRVIPFCSFNVIPELYRDRVQREFGTDPEVWRKEHPETLDPQGKIVAYETKSQRRMSPEYRASIEAVYAEARRRFRPNPSPATTAWPIEAVAGK